MTIMQKENGMEKGKTRRRKEEKVRQSKRESYRAGLVPVVQILLEDNRYIYPWSVKLEVHESRDPLTTVCTNT